MACLGLLRGCERENNRGRSSSVVAIRPITEKTYKASIMVCIKHRVARQGFVKASGPRVVTKGKEES